MLKTLTLGAALLAGTATIAVAQDSAASREGGFGLGRAALPEEVAAWDWDVRPDGTGLPVGEGDVWTGEELFVDYCSACHGDFGEAVGRWPVLAGGQGTLTHEDPTKTIGSYWPYLSTVVDYVYRAMPYGQAESLTPDETYAIVAYLLNLNNVVDDDFVLSNETFHDVEMPNAGGFFMDDRDETEVAAWTREPCMTDCTDGAVEITMRATVLDVTPDEEGDDTAAAEPVVEENPVETGPSPELIAAGAGIWRQCQACHEVGEGARNRVGPALNGIVGADAGAREGFRYSPAFREAAEDGLVWTEENLIAYLHDPRSFMPRSRMVFNGIEADEDIRAVLAYIMSETPQ
ncbi:Sulfite dehydrogenase cytochrome subunit SoxD [Roseibacterium elongatum DSM 19469]|uniref:Sulfite dehydrogenase cytochrome subunit SoxD n=1 Tax=Roseicyclus elongatus DSM 19469 TaxID=1294273 RepID=W8SPY1_9RHOB|nr:c-type cytochrome [Roseibacterium elongatum]AHM04590.1 Sulfite dehydrogenase cytochrome subunit SoxD [Roseibacterium elongatum DSM 19469]